MGVGRTTPPDRAFERMYRRHVEDVYRYAIAVLGNAPDAEDVTQTTFLNAYRSLQSGTRPKEPAGWLVAIAHNVCRQRFRTAARRPREVMLDPELAPAVEDDSGRYRRDDIQRALESLTFEQRSALAMRELEGRSYKEIAAALETTVSAVETLIFRARKAFREQLEGTLTCSEAERAVSRQLDGELARGERGALRAHLRECEECATLARRFRAQRSALKRLVVLPLPGSLASFSGGGAATTGSLIGLKAAAIGSALVVAAGATTTELVTHTRSHVVRTAPPPARVVPLVDRSRPQHTQERPARRAPTPVASLPLPATRRNHAPGQGVTTSLRPATQGAAAAPGPGVVMPAEAPPVLAPSGPPVTPAAAPPVAAPAPAAAPAETTAPALSPGQATSADRPSTTPATGGLNGRQQAQGKPSDPGSQGNGNPGGGKPDDPGQSTQDHGNAGDGGNGNGQAAGGSNGQANGNGQAGGSNGQANGNGQAGGSGNGQTNGNGQAGGGNGQANGNGQAGGSGNGNGQAPDAPAVQVDTPVGTVTVQPPDLPPRGKP